MSSLFNVFNNFIWSDQLAIDWMVMWLGNIQILPYLFQSLNTTILGILISFRVGLDFISINDPNLEHTIRISKKKKQKV